MAEVTLASASEKQKWLSSYYSEYVRESGFMPYMGKKPTSIINVKYELQEEAGKTINIPLITRLKNSGVTGSGVLQGNEEQLGNFNCAISIDWRRNAVKIPKSTSYKTDIDLWGAGKEVLKTWEAEKVRDDIANAMLSVELGVKYQDSTTAVKNAWSAANKDRILFGALQSNWNATLATALGNVDTTSDKLTVATAELAKRMAKLADPHIRPFKTGTGREYYVMFCGSRAFRDLKADSAMQQANRDARAREGNAMDDNPLFQDGDLIKDGIIYHEVPEIDAIASTAGLDNAGNGGNTDVRPCFLCGAQAVGIAWGQEPQFQTDLKDDYNFRPGVAIEELLGVRKLFFASGSLGNLTVQHGMVTLFVAAAADS